MLCFCVCVAILPQPAKPMTTLLLAQVSRIDTDAVKDASFPFAVHFRGKGSPWILNANSNVSALSVILAPHVGGGYIEGILCVSVCVCLVLVCVCVSTSL